MPRIISVKPLLDYRLAVCFDDGTEGVIELQDRLFGSVFEPLRDPAIFQQVFVDEFGVVAWPNGADIAPDAMHERLDKKAQIAASR
jgi:hypothetical protein